jgi:uncharacterized protein
MNAYFLESSALVKRYASEIGTSWLFSIVRPSANNLLSVVRITSVEVASALARKKNSGNLSQVQYDKAQKRFERELFNRYLIVDVSAGLIHSAIRLVKIHHLRGYDAVQLAGALEISTSRKSLGLSTLIFVSADGDLNRAAITEGLVVENPTDHS